MTTEEVHMVFERVKLVKRFELS